MRRADKVLAHNMGVFEHKSVVSQYADIVQRGSTSHEIALFKHAFPNPGHVLDVFCRCGLGVSALLWLGHKVTGVDTSRAMISCARQLCDDARARFLRKDIMSNPVRRGHYDYAYSGLNALSHIPESRLPFALRNVFMSLRPGGRFLLFCNVSDVAHLARGGYASDFMASTQEMWRRYHMLPISLKERFVSHDGVCAYSDGLFIYRYRIRSMIKKLSLAGFVVEHLNSIAYLMSSDDPLDRQFFFLCSKPSD